jgi:hypothetical protein
MILFNRFNSYHRASGCNHLKRCHRGRGSSETTRSSSDRQASAGEALSCKVSVRLDNSPIAPQAMSQQPPNHPGQPRAPYLTQPTLPTTHNQAPVISPQAPYIATLSLPYANTSTSSLLEAVVGLVPTSPVQPEKTLQSFGLVPAPVYRRESVSSTSVSQDEHGKSERSHESDWDILSDAGSKLNSLEGEGEEVEGEVVDELQKKVEKRCVLGARSSAALPCYFVGSHPLT